MIIDLCPFYSELDLLSLRLHTHTFADKFIIWEFSKDFQGKTKPLHFLNNRQLFKDFENRIIYRNYDYLEGQIPFERAKHYRDVILPELRQYDNHDIVINTDTDEILRNITNYQGGIMATELSWYVYYMNYSGGVWVNGSICQVKDLKDKSLIDLRYNFYHERRKWPTELLKNAGWHFSWLGDHAIVKDKFRNFGHAEGWDEQLLNENYFNELREKRIKHWNKTPLQLVGIDNSYPEYLIKNIDKYKKYIYEPKVK